MSPLAMAFSGFRFGPIGFANPRLFGIAIENVADGSRDCGSLG